MAITATYTAKQFNEVLRQSIQAAEDKFIAGLVDIGKEFVKDAKLNGQYENQSGDLRSSIGFIVAKGRKIIASEFNTVAGGKNGKSKGFFLAKSLLSGNTEKNVRLIVVAGMEYASILESKGRDVLTGSSLAAVSNLKQLIERVKNGH